MDAHANTFNMDPELALDMAIMLAQRFKVARAQAERRSTVTPYSSDPSEREKNLISENDSLRADNASLREIISKLQHELDKSCVKSEETNPLQFAESSELERQKDKALRTKEKLSILREKYKRMKARAHEYCENLNELRVNLENCSRLLESKTSAVSELDFRDVLNDIACESVEDQVELSSIEAYKLPKDVLDKLNGPYLINSNEVIWSPSGIAVGLVIKPMFRYNPKSSGGTWIKQEYHFDVGKQMNVCLLNNSSGRTRYLGTYERVGEKDITVIAVQALKYIDHAKLDYVSKRTIMYPDLLPPAQTQMIKNMYKEGIIKIQCFAIRYVAFDQSFADKIEDTCASHGQRNPQRGTVISEPGSAERNERKRKRNSRSTVHSNPKKRKS